jgi:hypothetical protein
MSANTYGYARISTREQNEKVFILGDAAEPLSPDQPTEGICSLVTNCYVIFKISTKPINALGAESVTEL